MVFSSVPVYLDPPDWHQQFHLPPVQQAGLIPTISNVPSNEIPSSQVSALTPVDRSGYVPPGSMTDRAGLAKIPQPETAIKCPRCESTNTKFCYFNNYSLSQPRHFCKTCRRYWSRGGALRNVPVGGGCRRNKKSKNTSSGRAKSCAAATATAADSKQSATAQNNRVVPEIPVHHHNLTAVQPQSHLSSLMATLQSLSGYGNVGVNLGGMHPLVDTGDHHGTNLQHFPLLENNLLANSATASRVHDQIYGVKMEETVLKRPFLGFVADQNSNSWGDDDNNNYWTDLSSLNNSSAGTATNDLL